MTNEANFTITTRLKFFFLSFSKLKGLFAKRDIKKGELVIEYENKERKLLSKSFLESNDVSEPERKHFKKFSIPVSDDLFVTWSDNPDEWIPINHSCEPNIWYENSNENLYARRDIKKEEELTRDYATFYANYELHFECKCRQACCRQYITQCDYLKPDLIEKYNGHFSCFLTSKLNEIVKT